MTLPVAPRLEVANISKTFGSTRVLTDASVVVQPGELHALLGQNGSGKSTLVKILTGYHAPDAGGSISVDGKPLRLPVAWDAAHAAGVAVVHQDFGLIDHLTVAENIGVGGFETTRFLRRVDWKAQEAVAARVLATLQLDISPSTLVGGLSAAHRAGVAIARAMRDLVPGKGLVILDESTRSLGRDELHQFHTMLKRIRETGTAMLLVSHSLDEVLTYTDKVSVLRDGHVVGAGLETSTQSEQSIARVMLGKDVDAIESRPDAGMAYPACVTITDLHGPGAAGLNIEIGAGEVVGLTGLPGSGFESIPYLISGAQPATGGQLTINKTTLNLARTSVSETIKAGVVLIPERRDRDGLAMSLSVQDNISLPTLRVFGRRWWTGTGWQRQQTTAAIHTLGIRPNAPSRLISELSGGNQQKVLLAKWMSVGPKLMIMHEPTQAVDVGARADILNAVHRAAASGMAVLLVSVESSDLAAACDRVLVYESAERLREVRSQNADVILDAVYAAAATSAPTAS